MLTVATIFFDRLPEDRSREFLKTVIEHNRTTDWFRSYWLRFEDLYIAYLFGFEQDGVFYAWNITFHPDYSHLPFKTAHVRAHKRLPRKKV